MYEVCRLQASSLPELFCAHGQKLYYISLNPMMLSVCSALILAAGRSIRMGSEKSSLLTPTGSTFLEHLVSSYLGAGCAEVAAVLNPEGMEKLSFNPASTLLRCKCIVNLNSEKGRFLSIKKGLKLLNPQHHIFIHNIDNPFVDNDLLVMMSEKLAPFDFIYPVFEQKGGHPVLITPRLAEQIVNCSEDDYSLKSFLAAFKGRTLPTTTREILLNLNTRDEYMAYFFAPRL